MLDLLSKIFGNSGDVLTVEDLTKGTIVDVRTAQEFQQGHINGSINIPLQEFDQNLLKYRQLASPVITCCASGNRSGVVAKKLNAAGLRALNGGGWQQLNDQVSPTSRKK
jgi:rhodanese-related sulfurtransferase